MKAALMPRNWVEISRKERDRQVDPVRWAVQGVLAVYLLPVVAVVLLLGGTILAVQQVIRATRWLREVVRNAQFVGA